MENLIEMKDANERRVKDKEKAITAVLAEMIDPVETYLAVAPFELIEGFEAHPGEHIFPAKDPARCNSRTG